MASPLAKESLGIPSLCTHPAGAGWSLEDAKSAWTELSYEARLVISYYRTEFPRTLIRQLNVSDPQHSADRDYFVTYVLLPALKSYSMRITHLNDGAPSLLARIDEMGLQMAVRNCKGNFTKSPRLEREMPEKRVIHVIGDVVPGLVAVRVLDSVTLDFVYGVMSTEEAAAVNDKELEVFIGQGIGSAGAVPFIYQP